MENEIRATLVNDAKNLFAGMSIDDINETLAEIRTSATEAKKAKRKAVKDAEKAERAVEKEQSEKDNLEVLKTLKEGDDIIILIGSGKNVEQVEAVFVKITEKRFTVNLDGKNRSTMFGKFVAMGTFEDQIADESNEDGAVA